MKADISGIIDAFPQTRIAVLVATGLSVAPERSSGLDARIEAVQRETAARYELEAVGQIPEIQVWRKVYKGFGIKSTSYRSSVERLLRNVLRGRGLARINGFVDAYNMISLKYLLPAGADDLAKISGDIAFRIADGSESFIPLGSETEENDPPKPGEVIYADAGKVLCRRWNWYQDARSPVTAESSKVVLTIQAGDIGDLHAAAEEMCALVSTECQGRAEFVVLDANTPAAEVPLT